MDLRTTTISSLLFTVALVVPGLTGCDKADANTDAKTHEKDDDPDESKDGTKTVADDNANSAADGGDSGDDSAINLCEAYSSCNACIQGQMLRGKNEGEAETQCSLAVTGCWTTWDKPVKCGEQVFDRQVSDDPDSANLCKAYTSCNDCISGQIGEGKSRGEAETQCGLAVTGCWTTWDKPIKCGDKTYDERPN